VYYVDTLLHSDGVDPEPLGQVMAADLSVEWSSWFCVAG
jgi:hypothetical protein